MNDTVKPETETLPDKLQDILNVYVDKTTQASSVKPESRKNLRTITTSERARELAKLSAAARRRKKEMYLASTKTITGNVRRLLNEVDEDTGLRNAELVARAMLKEAQKGNVAMVNLLLSVNKEQASSSTKVLLTAKLEDFIGGNSKLNDQIDDSCLIEESNLEVLSVEDGEGVCASTGEVDETGKVVDDTNCDLDDESPSSPDDLGGNP